MIDHEPSRVHDLPLRTHAYEQVGIMLTTLSLDYELRAWSPAPIARLRASSHHAHYAFIRSWTSCM